MPTTIPYDPSLTLGSIVEPAVLDNLLAISAAQAPIDAAQEKMNSLISMKRSIDMTVQELINMDVDPADLIKNSSDIKKSISQAAGDYAKIRITQEQKIQDLKDKIQVVHSSIESPIDYNKTQFKNVPLAADSLKMDCQYFSFDQNEQSAQNQVANIKSFVTGTIDFLGDQASTEASTAVASQINHQRENHDVEGTLVIAVTCTHKDSQVLAPFILDVDKSIRIWNNLFTDEQDKLKVNDPMSLMKASQQEGTDKEKFFNIISGATFGSCFIGMVHVLKTDATDTNQDMSSVASSLQDQFQVGGWFSSESGGFGVDSSFSDDIKNMLSSQQITSHVNLVTMGVIPSIKSNQVQIGVKQFADFDPAKMMEKLADFSNSTGDEQKSVASSAASARSGAQMLSIQGANVKSMMSGLANIDDGQNKMLDINSMMTAFEDYVDKAVAGNVGIPINYYLKQISKAQLAQMWVAKYFPKKFLHISGDDSASDSQAGSTSE